MDLFVVGGIHEMVGVAIRVEVLHLGLVQNYSLHLVRGAEPMVVQSTATDVAHPRLNEGAQVARRAVLRLVDGIEFVVVPDHHSGAKVVGLHAAFLIELLGGASNAPEETYRIVSRATLKPQIYHPPNSSVNLRAPFDA